MVDHVVAEVCVGERGAAGDGEWRAHCVVLEIDRVAGQSCVICGGAVVGQNRNSNREMSLRPLFLASDLGSNVHQP